MTCTKCGERDSLYELDGMELCEVCIEEYEQCCVCHSWVLADDMTELYKIYESGRSQGYLEGLCCDDCRGLA